MKPRTRCLWAWAAIALPLAAGGAWWGLGQRAVDPNQPAKAAYARGDWQAALGLARKRLSAAPDDRQALRVLARASARLGRDADTESFYRRLGSEGAESEDFLLLGQTLIRQGQEAPGLRMLERAREVAPDDPEVLRTLAERHQQLGFPLASESAARALAANPDPSAAVLGRWLLAQRLGELDRPAETGAAIESVLDHDPSGKAAGTSARVLRIQAARAWLRASQPTRARTLVQPLAEEMRDPEAAWLLSRAFLQEGDREAASQAIAAAGDFGRDDPTRPEPAPRVGSASCAECHAAIHRTHRSSRHARTLAFGRELDARPVPSGPLRDPGDRRVAHQIERTGPGAVRVSLSATDARLAAVFAYAIGSGNRGWTPLVRDDTGRFWEYRLTRYADPVGWDVTIHHPGAPEAGSELGKPLLEDQVRDCLGCHSTNPDAVREGRAAAAEPQGIDCERCHGPAAHHLAALRLDFPDPAIARPKRAAGPQRDALCAQCHRAPRGFPDDVPDFVRFQSPTLARSRCYVESGGALDCVTCHNPHRDAATEPAAYEGICLSCHGGQAGKPTIPARSCPVDAAKGCIRCHMPRVPEVIPHTAYTDHFIRVHRE